MKKFCMGMLTAMIVMPLIDMFMDLAAQWVQALKCKPFKIVREFNDSQSVSCEEEPKKKFKWGFVQEDAPEEIEEDSEEFDEDFEEEDDE